MFIKKLSVLLILEDLNNYKKLIPTYLFHSSFINHSELRNCIQPIIMRVQKRIKPLMPGHLYVDPLALAHKCVHCTPV